VSRTVVVPVRHRSPLSFRVAADHGFAMFTAAGNRAVARLVNRLITALAGGDIKSSSDLRQRYRRGVRAIARQGHDEVYDTDVGEEIFAVLEVPCARAGYDAEAVMG
jgi:hypothetical protein